MSHVRIIARLDIKGPNLIKGIHLEGLRVVGDPHEHALRYYAEGADELLFMDIVASLYQRNNLSDIIKRTANRIYVPITVGGGIRSLDDVSQMMHSGADKVAINTAAIARPELIAEVARRYGSQCMVLGIEAKRIAAGRWEAYTDNGRERTGLDALQWAARGVELGAGELLVTSVDREGTQKGMDLEFLAKITARVNVPVIACGGAGTPEHASRAITDAGADAVAVASMLHYRKHTVGEIKARLAQADVPVRSSA